MAGQREHITQHDIRQGIHSDCGTVKGHERLAYIIGVELLLTCWRG
jgi:hypothetical protein